MFIYLFDDVLFRDILNDSSRGSIRGRVVRRIRGRFVCRVGCGRKIRYREFCRFGFRSLYIGRCGLSFDWNGGYYCLV